MDASIRNLSDLEDSLKVLKAAGADADDHDDNEEYQQLVDFKEFMESEPEYKDQTDFIDALLDHTYTWGNNQLATVTDIIKDAEYVVHDSLEAYGESMMDCMEINLPIWAVSHFDVETFAQDCLNNESDYFTLGDGTIIILSN